MSILSRFAGLFRGRRLDSDLAAELRSHIEMRTEQNIASGMSPEEARADALRRFGNATWMQEETRRADILPWLESLAQDARYALRTFRRAPVFTAAAVITLALAIGANTAVFSVLRSVLLRALPFPDPERLVRIDEVDQTGEFGRNGIALKGVSQPDFADFREQNHSFEQIGGWTGGEVTFSSTDTPRHIAGAWTTWNLFPTLGIRPLLGRGFLPAEEADGANHVAILSYALWQSMGGRESIVGSQVMLSGEGYTVVGVMPPGFQFPLGQESEAVWMPTALSRNPKLRVANYFEAVGRLKPGVTKSQAKADLDLIVARAAAAQAATSKNGPLPLHWVTEINGLKDYLTMGARSPLGILGAAVLCVLLIATANVASLWLSRAASRQKEVAVRLAMGASRARVLRQVMTESVLLALGGGVAGLVLAYWGKKALVALAPGTLPRIAAVEIDIYVVLFTVTASILAGLAAGLGPALRAARFDLNEVIKQGAAAFRPGKQPLHAVFVVTQLALAAILLYGASLMVRTLVRLTEVDPGFDPHGVVTAEVSLPGVRYGSAEQQAVYSSRVLGELGALPGVERVAAASALPLGGSRFVFHLVVTNPGQPAVSVISLFNSVSPDYFKVLGIPLARGRFFEDADTAGSQPVAIVNEALARQRWPNEDPIGKSIASGFTKGAAVVVGVVHDIHQDRLDTDAKPELYAPLAQRPWPFVRFLVRAQRGDAAGLAPAVRAQIQSADRTLAIDRMSTLDALVARSVAERRFYMLLLATFAGLALLLAGVGVFGVVAYAVTQRTREIGVRMALGASAGDIGGLMFRRALLLTALGLGIGLGASAALAGVLRSLLFQMQPRDPLTFAVSAVALTGVALLASYWPTRRAMRVDPLVALRHE
jgi:predicted permease